ncbi:hypothetical protein CCACVL1_20272, partial [Corchorus capsularis]
TGGPRKSADHTDHTDLTMASTNAA